MKDNILKKEFRTKDVERVRNLVSKDYTSKTGIGVGYSKKEELHKEGEVWEENGRRWTIKNNIKQNITRLDAAKNAVRIPLRCPNCGGPMNHHLAKKMFRIHGFCFDPCTVEYEASLRRAGLYKSYEQNMIKGNLSAFVQDIEAWAAELVGTNNTYVTEDGVVEDWQSSKDLNRQKLLTNIQIYTSHIRNHL